MKVRVPLAIGGFVAVYMAANGCHGGEKAVFRESSLVMGTVVEIAVAHRSEETARAAIKQAMAEFRRIDDIMNPTKPGSLISVLNSGGSSSQVVVGEELFRIIRQAASISDASRGAFDVTIRPLVQAWGFDKGGAVPEAGVIAERQLLVGYRMMKFDESVFSVGFSVHGMAIDLGAIAKGWAIDRAIEQLKARGIRDAIVDAGGDLGIMGARPGWKGWRIGVRDPREAGALLATLELNDTAIATSGDYERYFVADGVRYHHILDPKTGHPARGCLSVTVLAPTTTEADACATAAFVLGPGEGIAFLRSRPGVRGLIVGAEGALHWTDESLARMAGR